MKAVLTFFFVLTLGANALANTKADDKIDGIEMGIVLVDGTDRISVAAQVETGAETSLARLYKFQNSRVKKALAFTVKQAPAKLA